MRLRSLAIHPTHLLKTRGDEYLAAENLEAPQNGVIAMKYLIRLGKAWHRKLSLSILLIAFSSLCIMLSARTLGLLVDALRNDASETRLTILCATVMLCEVCSIALQYAGRVNLATATNRILCDVRKALFKKLERLPMRYFDEQPLGRTLTRITSDVEGIEEFFGGTLARMLTAAITITMVFTTMMATDLYLGSIVVASALPALIFTIVTRNPVRNWLRVYKRQSAHMSARLAEYLNGMFVIKVLGLEDWTMLKYRESAADLLASGIGLINWNSILRPISLLFCSFPLLFILGYGGTLAIKGTIAVGTLVAFVRLSERFTQPIRIISQEIHVFQESLTSCERVYHLLNESEELDALGKGGTLKQAIRGDVEFRDVTMSYPGRAPALRGVTFKVHPGMRVGLVGATGSGKTTTLSLLSQLYPFQSGEILVDGRDIRTYDRQALRKQFGVVTQDVVIFRGTIRDNLAGALPVSETVDDQQIEAAARKTGLWPFIASLPEKLDHEVTDGGENISMGERQLIAMTRMLIKNPAILILDEATSNIDEQTEAVLQHAAEEAMEGRTCFIIAHRLSTVERCDLVLTFAQGRIVKASAAHALAST